jgi:hypothetical protein
MTVEVQLAREAAHTTMKNANCYARAASPGQRGSFIAASMRSNAESNRPPMISRPAVIPVAQRFQNLLQSSAPQSSNSASRPIGTFLYLLQNLVVPPRRRTVSKHKYLESEREPVHLRPRTVHNDAMRQAQHRAVGLPRRGRSPISKQNAEGPHTLCPGTLR